MPLNSASKERELDLEESVGEAKLPKSTWVLKKASSMTEWGMEGEGGDRSSGEGEEEVGKDWPWRAH